MLASLACAHRRLACRYWAGRVALRENRAPRRRFTAPRRSEAARPKINLSKSSRSGLCLAWARPAPGAALLGHHDRGVVSCRRRTLAREGRMTVTIGRRELLAALGGVAA